jgi:hypothetical protein
MAVTFTIEGLRVRGNLIPEKKLVSTWNRLTEKPFPTVTALQLEDSDFDKIIQLRRCSDDERRELEEWGRLLTARGTDACVFSADDLANSDYIVLVRKHPYHSLDEILEHELHHIVKGDL